MLLLLLLLLLLPLAGFWGRPGRQPDEELLLERQLPRQRLSGVGGGGGVTPVSVAPPADAVADADADAIGDWDDLRRRGLPLVLGLPPLSSVVMATAVGPASALKLTLRSRMRGGAAVLLAAATADPDAKPPPQRPHRWPACCSRRTTSAWDLLAGRVSQQHHYQ